MTGALPCWIGMELARRRAAAADDPSERSMALERAGDAYERGRATLRAPGASETPAPPFGERASRTAGAVLAVMLDAAPGLRRRLEDWRLG